MGGKKVVAIEMFARSGERVNSPRSLEACRRSGIDPNELQPKSVNEFLNERLGGLLASKFTLVEKEAAVLRHRHYEQSRQGKLELVVRERDALLRSQEDNRTAGPPQSPVPNATTKQPMSQPLSVRRTKSAGLHHSTRRRTPHRRTNDDNDDGNDDDNDNDNDNERDNPIDVSVTFGDLTTAQLEERRLAKMKLRQQRELRSVVEMEAKLARLQHESARRSADETRRRDEFQRELQAKRAQFVARKHERELAKKQDEDRDAVQRRLEAKALAERDRVAHEEEQQRQAQRQQEALQRERERALKADAFRRETELLLQHQEDVVAANRQRMREKERLVLTKAELAMKRRQHEARERRERATARLQHAAVQNQLSLERRKGELESKQASAAERAKELQRKTLLELTDRASQQRKDEDVRRKRLDAAQRQREHEALALQTKREAADAKLARAELERERARQLQSVEKTLVGEEKQQSAERIKRREEYARLQLLARIAGDDERSREIKAQKHALVQARQQVALDALLRKHRIVQAVEQLQRRHQWDKYEEILYEL